MFNLKLYKTFTFLLFLGLNLTCISQVVYTLTPSHKNEDCTIGAVGLQLAGQSVNDTITITWSSGEINVYSLNDKVAGDYYVNVNIKSKLDTSLTITVEKEPCKVFISNNFTPNGDNYNDLWQISNTEFYPKFELYLYNKWGQQVHSQKKTYTPWDGAWNGITSPDGTYYYVFYYDGDDKSKLLKGDVTIIR